jgi:hypothetical protein
MKYLLLLLLASSLFPLDGRAAPSCFPDAPKRRVLDVSERKALAHSKANTPAACLKGKLQCHFEVSRMDDEILVVVEVALPDGKPPKCLFPLHAGQASLYDRDGKFVRTMPHG